jgi:hypothetical protein
MMTEHAGARLGRVVSISEVGHGGGLTITRFRSGALESVSVASGASVLLMDLVVVFELG